MIIDWGRHARDGRTLSQNKRVAAVHTFSPAPADTGGAAGLCRGAGVGPNWAPAPAPSSLCSRSGPPDPAWRTWRPSSARGWARAAGSEAPVAASALRSGRNRDRKVTVDGSYHRSARTALAGEAHPHKRPRARTSSSARCIWPNSDSLASETTGASSSHGAMPPSCSFLANPT